MMTSVLQKWYGAQAAVVVSRYIVLLLLVLLSSAKSGDTLDKILMFVSTAALMSVFVTVHYAQPFPRPHTGLCLFLLNAL